MWFFGTSPLEVVNFSTGKISRTGKYVYVKVMLQILCK